MKIRQQQQLQQPLHKKAKQSLNFENHKYIFKPQVETKNRILVQNSIIMIVVNITGNNISPKIGANTTAINEQSYVEVSGGHSVTYKGTVFDPTGYGSNAVIVIDKDGTVWGTSPTT